MMMVMMMMTNQIIFTVLLAYLFSSEGTRPVHRDRHSATLRARKSPWEYVNDK